MQDLYRLFLAVFVVGIHAYRKLFVLGNAICNFKTGVKRDEID